MENTEQNENAADVPVADASEAMSQPAEEQSERAAGNPGKKLTSVQKRVAALKTLQFEHLKVSMEYYAELQQLEASYNAKYQSMFDKRRDIVAGVIDPPLQQEDEAPLNVPRPKCNVRGVPNFWFTIFKNVPLLADLMQPADEPVIRKLKDIVVNYGYIAFSLDFHFETNEYFTNSVLSKQFFRHDLVHPTQRSKYHDLETYTNHHSVIHWREGKDLTLTYKQKRQRHKRTGIIRIVNVPIVLKSFFHFFSEERKMSLLLANLLRTRVVPRAVLLFTGQISVKLEQDHSTLINKPDNDVDDANEDDDDDENDENDDNDDDVEDDNDGDDDGDDDEDDEDEDDDDVVKDADEDTEESELELAKEFEHLINLDDENKENSSISIDDDDSKDDSNDEDFAAGKKHS